MTTDFESLFAQMNARALERREAKRRKNPNAIGGRASGLPRIELNRQRRYGLIGVREWTIQQLAELFGVSYDAAYGWMCSDMSRPGSRLERTADGKVRLRKDGAA